MDLKFFLQTFPTQSVFFLISITCEDIVCNIFNKSRVFNFFV